MQSKLFGMLYADIAMRPYNVMGHSVRVRLDLLVQLWAAYVEDALLAKFGACFQKNLLDLHYIVFNKLNWQFWLPCVKLSKLIFKMWGMDKSFESVTCVLPHVFPRMKLRTIGFSFDAININRKFFSQYKILFYVLTKKILKQYNFLRKLY